MCGCVCGCAREVAQIDVAHTPEGTDLEVHTPWIPGVMYLSEGTYLEVHTPWIPGVMYLYRFT